MCSACGARRDRLLINRGRDVSIRCRCGSQWRKPELTRADDDAMIAIPGGATYPTSGKPFSRWASTASPTPTWTERPAAGQ
jgi:hypothetical protein